MVNEEYCDKPYLLVGGPLRYRRDGQRVRVSIEEAGNPPLVTFQRNDVGVDPALLLKQGAIQAYTPPRRAKVEPVEAAD